MTMRNTLDDNVTGIEHKAGDVELFVKVDLRVQFNCQPLFGSKVVIIKDR